MRVTKRGAESTIKPYLFEESGMVFLHEDMVVQARDAVAEKYCNVYCGVEEGQAGSKKLVISSVNKSKFNWIRNQYCNLRD